MGNIGRESSLNVYSMRGKINFGSGVYNVSIFIKKQKIEHIWSPVLTSSPITIEYLKCGWCN